MCLNTESDAYFLKTAITALQRRLEITFADAGYVLTCVHSILIIVTLSGLVPMITHAHHVTASLVIHRNPNQVAEADAILNMIDMVLRSVRVSFAHY